MMEQKMQCTDLCEVTLNVYYYGKSLGESYLVLI